MILVIRSGGACPALGWVSQGRHRLSEGAAPAGLPDSREANAALGVRQKESARIEAGESLSGFSHLRQAPDRDRRKRTAV